MALSPAAPTGQLQRREKFRAFMQAFNPTARAEDVIEAGLVLEDLHRSMYLNLAGRADLEPGSQQLLVGGIGSGKTTELLLAARWLRAQGSALSLYIDITAETDLSGLNSGSLLASFGTHLSRRLFGNPNIPREKLDGLSDARQKVQEYAFGKNVRVWVNPDDEWNVDVDDDEEDQTAGYFVTHRVEGKLRPPLPVLLRDVREIHEPLEKLLRVARDTYKEIVVIFDGLDRLVAPEKFWAVAHQDLRLFRRLKISVLATAPISVLYGAGQSVSDQFDRVQHLPAMAIGPDENFLRTVLVKRGGSYLLSDSDAGSICRYSGGVLRDLISLARDAAEEAYISGHDAIRPEDVDKVVQQLGTAYLRGLGPDAIKSLVALEKNKAFQVNHPPNLELLVTRRVLEYSSTDFRVHPALFSVIQKMEPKGA